MCVSCLFLPAAHPALLFSSLKRNLPQQRKPLALLVPPLPAARAWRQWASLGCLRCLQCAALHFRRLTALPVQAVPIQPHSVSFLAKLSSFSLIQFAKLPVICQKFSVGPQDSLTFIYQGAFKNCVDKNRDRQFRNGDFSSTFIRWKMSTDEGRRSKKSTNLSTQFLPIGFIDLDREASTDGEGTRFHFLSHTLQILEINLSFESFKMILRYLIKISFSF